MKIEKMQTIFETILNDNLDNCCGSNIKEVFEYLADIGFSKKEAFDFVDRNYLDDINWQCDDEEETINTETGEGVFWKEYKEEEEDEEKSTPVPDYFRLIEMLDKVKAPYTNYKKERMIEIKKDYTAVDFLFDENFNLIEVAF